MSKEHDKDSFPSILAFFGGFRDISSKLAVIFHFQEKIHMFLILVFF